MYRIPRGATLVALGTLALSQPRFASAQQPLPLKHAGKPTQPSITTADLMTRLYIFADDSMMGRSAGTPGGMKGTAYIEREVRRIGLVPAGDNGTFFQAIPLYTRSFDPASNLTANGKPLVGGTDYFALHNGGTPRSLNGAKVIFAGNAADASTLIPAPQAAGKVVLLSGLSTGMGNRYPQALGFIAIVPAQQVPLYQRFSASTSTTMREEGDTASTQIALAIPEASAQAFLGVPLANARPGTIGATLGGDVLWKTADAPARNVVAILPGSDPKLRNQYVAIGAHNDHVGIRRGGAVDHDSLRAFNRQAEKIFVARTGHLPSVPGSGLTPDERASIKVNMDGIRRGRPARMDSIYNGADDDGSGSMGVLEIAENFAAMRVKPKRSLLFVWHTGEELGLFGAEYFTDHPTVPRDSIVAQLNVDMIGRGDAGDIPGGNPGYLQLIGSRRLSTELGDIVETVNTSGRHGFTFDYQFDADGHPENYYCRSDHYEYARYGIPVVFMSTGDHVDYHQLTDEPQYISYPHLARVTSFLGDVAAHVANLNHRVVVDKPKPDPKGSCRQ